MKRGVKGIRRKTVAAASLWVAGCAAAIRTPYADWQAYLWVISLIAAGLSVLLKLKTRWVVLSLLILLSGFVHYQAFDHRNHTHAVAVGTTKDAYDGKPALLEGELASPVEVDGDRASFVMVVHQWSWEGEAAFALRERVQASVRLMKQEEQEIVRQWKRGDLIRFEASLELPGPARNFGGFDYASYLRRQHIHWTASAKGTEGITISASEAWGPGLLLRWNDRFRARLAEELDRLFPGEEAGYMKGLLIGLREDLDPERFRQFSRLGLTHILAISGMHVAVFTGVLLWVLRLFRVTRETALTAVLCLLPFYVIFTGSSPSVVRAGLTAMAALFATRKHWLKDGRQLLGGAALAMLLWNPYYVQDVGFQLSFLVTYGLMIGVAPVGRLLPIRNRVLNSALSVSITAQLVSFPLTVFYFNQFSLMSLPANVLLVPLISFLVTPLGSAALAVSPLLPAAGPILAVPTSWMNRLSFWIVEKMIAGPDSGLQLIWPTPSFVWIMGYYGLLTGLFFLLQRRLAVLEKERNGVLLFIDAPRRLRRMAWGAAVCAVLWMGLCIYGYSPDRWLQRSLQGTVAFLDVGQGDAAYIRTPEGKHILIDGGGTILFRKDGEEWKERLDPYDVGRKTVVPLLKQRGVHRLDYLIISHEDTDHIGGLQAVLEEIPVGAILFNGTVKSGRTAETLLRTAVEQQIPLIPAYQGQVIRPDAESLIQMLSPDRQKGDDLFRSEEQNEETVVCLITMLGYRFLFTGDIDIATERSILAELKELEGTGVTQQQSMQSGWQQRQNRRTDVMKAAHHGSKGSSSPEWVEYWNPAVSVVSAGVNNIYGHPNPLALERLQAGGSRILRTDKNGEIQFSVNRGGLSVRTKLP